jgi:hypothetical protein
MRSLLYNLIGNSMDSKLVVEPFLGKIFLKVFCEEYVYYFEYQLKSFLKN